MKSRVQAVVFDVDGVLVHPWRFRNYLARCYGLTPEITASFFEGPFIDSLIGNADLREILQPYLATWGWEGSVSEFIGTWFAVENAPDEAVLTLARAIKQQGIACFVASTQERLRAKYITNEMGFGAIFDRLFFSCHLAVKKPDVAFFHTVVERVGLPPETLLLVDDMLANVNGAQAAGWKAVHFTSPATLQEQLNPYLRPITTI